MAKRDIRIEWRDDRRRVTGRAQYSADVTQAEALHAAFLLSTESHARIVSIDTSQAESLEGVKAVITGQEIGARRFGRSLRDYPILAVDRVLFAGQRVAAVAAVDADTARRAVELIRVEYETLASILSLDDAMADNAPVLHPDLMSYVGIDEGHPDGNLQGGTTYLVGDDIDVAFDRCDWLLETVFTFDRNHSAPLETHACLVIPGDEETVVYSAHKEPYGLRRSLGYLTGEPEDHFTVAPVHIGGDFGSKAAPYLEAACFLLARKAGHPVRARMSYYEELTTTSARHQGSMRIRTGVKCGRMHAFELEAVVQGGAFGALKPQPVRIVSFVKVGMAHYDVPNRDERSVAVYTNTLPAGHVRSPGEFKAIFACESQIDLVARQLGHDPIEFRMAHTSEPRVQRILHGLREIVTRWSDGLDVDSGIGISLCDRSAGSGRTRVLVEADTSGVHVAIPVPDQGSGMYAVFQNIVASTLGIRTSDVTIDAVGTDPQLTDKGAGGSRVTSVAGGACVKACQTLLNQLDRRPKAESQTYWLAERLQELGKTSVSAQGEMWTHDRGTPTYGGVAVQVAVDRLTGKVTVQRAEFLIDVGRVWNEVGFRGQIEGGFVYGLSQTLYESLGVEDGQVITASLGDYKIACIADVPPLKVTILPPHDLDREASDIRGGVGEIGNLGVPAAIANAIHNAVGVRVTSLPITSESIWRLLNE